MALSSIGLGRCPLKAERRVRFPLELCGVTNTEIAVYVYVTAQLLTLCAATYMLIEHSRLTVRILAHISQRYGFDSRG